MTVEKLESPIVVSGDLSSKMANASFFAALMVILIHCYQVAPCGSAFWWFSEIVGGGKLATGGFTRCAVPFFFVASGFFLAGHFGENAWWIRAVVRRLKTVVVPYFIWSAVACVPIALLMIMKTHIFPDWRFWAHGFGIDDKIVPYLTQLWFLRALFIWVFFSPLLIKFANKIGLICLFSIYIIVYTGILNLGWRSYALLEGFFSLEGAFFMTLGMWLRWHKITDLGWLGRPWVVGTLSLSVLCLYAIVDYIGISRLAFLIKLLAIPPSLLFFWHLVPSRKLGAALVSMAFPIYLSHMFFSRILRKFLMTIWFPEGSIAMFAMLAIVFIFSLGGACLLTVVMRRITPKFAKIAWGGEIT